jgi:hypothetical protein
MAELCGDARIASDASDVCEKCFEVFLLHEGCPCKICGRRHWHSEICYRDVEQAVARYDWPMERTKNTRKVLAERVFYYMVTRIAIRMNIRPDLSSVVVGFLSSARESRVQIWTRDITSLTSPLTLAQLAESLYDHVPFTLEWEAIDPPPHEHLPRRTIDNV